MMQTAVQAQQVLSDKFFTWWPMIAAEMDKVPHIWDKWWTKESIYEGVTQGRFQVWVAGTNGEVRVTLITQIAYYPANRILQGILVLGNSLEDCAPALDAVLEKFARDTGCTLCEVQGRPGWERFLSRYGFSKAAVVLHRRVTEHRVQ